MTYSEGKLNKFSIELDSNFGRHLVSTVPISPGEVIIDEIAIVQGPSPTSQNNLFNPPSVCLVCFVHFCPQTNPRVTCPKCCLCLCQEKNCAENVLHTDNECRVFEAFPQLRRILYENSNLYQFITVLRCLSTKSRHPTKWAQILQLQSNLLVNVTPLEKAFLLLSWDLVDVPNEKPVANANDKGSGSHDKTIQKMATHCLGVLQTNSFSNLRKTKSVENLYFFSSFMAHSCEANTDRQFDPFSSRVIVSAAREIKIGEPITNTYVPYLNNTKERNDQLLKPPWNFGCQCPRCVHPTERDSFLGGLQCHTCNNCTFCQFVIRYVEEGTTNNCKVTRGELTWNCPCGSGTGSSVKLHLAEEELAKTKEEDRCCWLEKTMKETWLHPNHSLLLNLKLQLCQSLGGDSLGIRGLSEKQLQKKVLYAQHVISVLNKLSSTWHMDIYMFKGRVYFHLWLAQWELEQRRNQKEKDEELAKTSSHFQLNPTDSNTPGPIRDSAEKAYRILKFAIPGTDEAKMKQVLDDEYKIYSLNYC